jgi:hypothetical protein
MERITSAAIPTGTSWIGRLSVARPLVGEFTVKVEGISGDSGMNFARNSASSSIAIVYELVGCNINRIVDLSVNPLNRSVIFDLGLDDGSTWAYVLFV